MAIIPTVRCSSMRRAIAFYTTVLDFECAERGDELDDPDGNTLRFTQP